MKHIVFVIGYYKNGGVSMRATNLANEFGRRGYRVTLLVTKGIGSEVFFDRHPNVALVSLAEFYEQAQNDARVIKDRYRQDAYIRRRSRMRYWGVLLSKTKRQSIGVEVSVLRRIHALRAFVVLNPDAVYIPFGAGYYEEAFFATRGYPCKLIYAERNAPEKEIPWQPKKRVVFYDILKQADGVVLQTEDEKLFYKDVLPAHVAVIHNPVKATLPEPYVGERRPVVVNFCRVAEQKNLPLLIDAFIKLHEDHSEYQLNIYGNAVVPEEEALCRRLKELVAERGCGEFIALLPPAADVHERVLDAAMFVSSSDFEGLSNSMIEAMAIGLLCVCTDCLGGGAREIIRNGENDLLVAIKEVDALYQGMKQFVEEPELADVCGQNATKLRKELAVERIAEQWLTFIEQV
jgi:glycosyltransferase involved in cell wall biosynthesis